MGAYLLVMVERTSVRPSLRSEGNFRPKGVRRVKESKRIQIASLIANYREKMRRAAIALESM